MLFPSTRIWYPVLGSALPATSGTPRPVAVLVPEPAPVPEPEPERTGTPASACHDGTGNTSLTPPPVAPWPAPSFHTVSAVMAPVAGSPCRLVPPQARTCGLDAGK